MPTLSATQSQLKQHEVWLISLRQDPSMTLTKIQTELETQKHITASLHQLETYFRNLGQRKNLSRPEWRTVFCALDSQKAFGRTCDLYISERLITEESLQKKRKNAKPDHALASYLVDADHLLSRLPDGVTVKLRAPRDSSDSSPLHNNNQQPVLYTGSGAKGEASTLVDSTHTDALLSSTPSLPQTGSSSSSIDPKFLNTTITGQAQVTAFPANMEPCPAETLFLPERSQLLMNAPAYDLAWNLNYNSVGLDTEDVVTCNIPCPAVPSAWSGGLPPINFELSLQTEESQDDVLLGELDYASPTSILSGHGIRDVSLVDSARLLVQGCGSVSCSRGQSSARGQFPTAEKLLDSLRSLVSTQTVRMDFYGPLSSVRPELFTDQFVELFLFSIVNNFAGVETLPAEVIMKFINQHEPVRSSILSHLKSGSSTIFSSALAGKLLEAAIEACDAKTAQDLLALELVKPDDIVCTEKFAGYHHTDAESQCHRTPIEKASSLRCFDIMELLLRFGADVNKTYEDTESRSERGALECAISLWGQYRPIDLKLVDCLLHHGATVSCRLMAAAVRWGDTGLIDKLISRVPSSEHVQCFSRMLTEAAEYLRNDIGYRVIQHVIQTCRDSHDNICVDSHQDLLARAMAKAARRKNDKLVYLLLPHGGQNGLDSALTAASRSGSHSLVHLLIAHGARADGPARIVNEPFELITTPLAEAIRADDAELLQIFSKEGAWDQIGEPGRLESAMHAIAECGNFAYLSRVLQLVPNPKSDALTGPLNAAIRASHEQVALRLVEAGADVNLKRSWPGPGPPLLEALRSKSHAITWAILESDVDVNYETHAASEHLYDETALEAATAWGDPEIIKALFFVGANINICRHEPPLSIAIKAGERSLVDLLLNLGADSNASSEWCLSPLAAAALVQDEETTEYLLDHGADSADEQAVMHAISHDRRLLHLILQHFRKQYPKGRSGFGGRVLHQALHTHDDALLDLCLSAGFDVNSLTSDKEYGIVTALGLAIKKYRGSHPELIYKLLDAGGDANVSSSERRERSWSAGSGRTIERVPVRQTAFLDAIETKSLSLVELLISKGADVRKAAQLGLKRTPLQKACEVTSDAIVDLLLQRNVDVNAAAAARGGATALQLAAKVGSTKIVKKLLDLGANVHAPGVRLGGRSAIEYAAEYGRLNMIPVLFNAAGERFAAGQYESAIKLAQKNGHLACAMLLRNLLSGNQVCIDAGSVADEGGRVDVVS